MGCSALNSRFIPACCSSDVMTFKGQPGNIIIVSPHPDDDVIGVGGTMALLARDGKNVFSLYVTDGSGCPRGESRVDKKTMARIRQQEAIDALHIVKAHGGVFLGYKSSQLLTAQKTAVVDTVSEVLEFFSAESIYLPSPLDRHPTHRVVTDIAVRALRRIRGYSPMLWGYSVWGGTSVMQGLTPVDISRVVNRKQKAILKHRSQIAYKAYDQGMKGRNRYEAVFLETDKPEKSQYVEMLLDMQELLLHRSMSINTLVKKLIKNLWR